MNSRDRVRAAVHFEQPDRLPCDESFWDGTIDAWRRQGMPPAVAPEDYFDFDTCSMALDVLEWEEDELVEGLFDGCLGLTKFLSDAEEGELITL